MATVNLSKVVSALPSTLTPDCIYFVRTGVGFDVFCSDHTGSVAHTLNSFDRNLDGGAAATIYTTNQFVDGGNAGVGIFVNADVAETDAVTMCSGNVLANDSGAFLLSVTHVNNSTDFLGVAVSGSAGGKFVVNADGSWMFDPDGDFAALSGTDTATTSVTYHASNGDAEASATLTVTVSSGSAIPWTPDQISGAMVLDPSVSSSLTYSSGALVSQWTDALGGSLVASTSTASLQPQKKVISGVDCVDFDGTDDRLTTNYKTNAGNYTLFFVLDRETTSTQDAVCSEVNMSNNSVGTNLFFYGSSIEFGHFKNISGDVDAVTATAPTRAQMLCARRENGVNHKLWGDGTLLGTTACVSISTASTNFLQIGHQAYYTGTPARPFDGPLALVVIVPSAISDTDRQKLEGWAAWKCHGWGLVDKLPSDHPYKSAPPTV